MPRLEGDVDGQPKGRLAKGRITAGVDVSARVNLLLLRREAGYAGRKERRRDNGVLKRIGLARVQRRIVDHAGPFATAHVGGRTYLDSVRRVGWSTGAQRGGERAAQLRRERVIAARPRRAQRRGHFDSQPGGSR